MPDDGDDGDQDIMDPVTDAEQEHYDDMNEKLDEATDQEVQDEAVCSECGESHDDGACWDDEEDQGDRTEYEPGQKRPLDHGVKVRGKIKRGTDTRDQDELLIEGRGQDAAEAAADFEAALQEAEANDWADRLRDLQPDQEGDDV